MTDHEALEALSKKVAQTGPITASALIDLIGGDRRETQRLVRAAIDRGVLTVGPSLKVECRTGQLIPAPSVDDAMVERAARAIDDAYKPEGSIPFAMDFDWMRDMRIAQAIAAISAMQVKP